MSLEEGFLHDICTSPEDLTPRLVYADWLDERSGKGDAARAEFIRLQCRLHREEVPPEEAERLKARQKELLERWKTAWMKPFKGLFANYEFKRGFVERATMKAKTFLDHGERILSLTPLRLPKLRDPAEHVEALAKCKLLERLWGLNLNYGKLGAARVVKLLASKHLKNLRWLDLGNNNIGPTGATRLGLAAKALPSLRYLALDDNNLGDAGLSYISGSPLLGQIEALNLDGNGLTDPSLQVLALSPFVGRLAQLHVCRHSGISAAGVEALLSSLRLPSLRWVCLDLYRDIADNLARLRESYGDRVKLTNEGSMGGLEGGPVAKL